MNRLAILVCVLAPSCLAQLHVAGSVALAAASNKPHPEYNPLARQMKITGDVAVEIKITTKGEVDSVQVLSGNAMLTGSVVRTVKTWRFKPFEQDGRPTIASTVLRFSFK